jgi:hypothetical protein
MKNFRFFNIYIVLLSVFFIYACDGLGDGSKVKSFDYDLQGKWVSNQTGLYSGSLKIDFDTITIYDYEEDWLSLVSDDSKRPFKDFPRNVRLKGYSEEKKIFIEYGDTVQNGIPYLLTETASPNKTKILEFNFGGRPEMLQLAETP